MKTVSPAGRLGVALCLGVLLVLQSACTVFRPSVKDRDLLLQSVQQFHRFLVDQDTVRALRFVPPDQRSRYQALLECFHSQVRMLEYRLGEIRGTEDPGEIKITVQVTSQSWDDLGARESLWEENWTFEDQRWCVRLDFEPFATFSRGCPSASR